MDNGVTERNIAVTTGCQTGIESAPVGNGEDAMEVVTVVVERHHHNNNAGAVIAGAVAGAVLTSILVK